MLEVSIKKRIGSFHLEVNFSVDREILSILGPSGSGKTITLLCVAGLLRPDTGFIRLNGRVLYDSQNRICLSARQRNIGFVFQNYALFPHLTIKENIAYGIKNFSRDDATHRVQELLELMHIPDLGNRYPKEISSGQQQRVSLARAIATSPDALLLDEPFSALDTPQRERLEYELIGLQEMYKKDFLFVTHDLAQGYKLSNRLAVFDSGRVAQCDCKNKVVTEPANRTVAKLTGIKNLMEGIVVSIDNGYVSVLVPEIERPLKILNGNHNDLSVNQPVFIGIRPEYVQLVDEEGENTVCCRTQQLVDGVTSIHGRFNAASDSERKYNLEVDLARFLDNDAAEGCSCLLRFPPDRMVVFSR